jgi:UDP-N-acetylglucosamine 1-carboxyvinyltransferase
MGTRAEIEGGHELDGEVPVEGYKHSFVLTVAASLLFSDTVEILNVPETLETRVLCRILQRLGAEVERGKGTLRIQARTLQDRPVPASDSTLIHGSLYLIPALLGRFGAVEIGLAGGCKIGDPGRGGARPTEHIISVLERFGARFEATNGRVRGRCSRLVAQEIDISDYSACSDIVTGPYISGATKAAILAALAAEGTTVIRNPYYKEAVADFLAFLRGGGCQIEEGSERIVIEGNPQLGSTFHWLMSDTTEIVTFIACAVNLRARFTITGLTVETARRWLAPELAKLRAMGVELQWGSDRLTVIPPEVVRGVDIEATSLGLNTDSQPFFTLMLLSADRPTRVIDRVWKHRFGYAHELTRLGADLSVGDGMVLVGPRRPGLAGRCVRASDTRAAAVVVLAALGIAGTTVVDGLEHIERGYEQFLPKLQALGAVIRPLS